MHIRLLLLLLSVAAPQAGVARDLSETVCAFTVKTDDGRFRIVPSEELHVLDQVAEASTFRLPTDAPRDIASIMCARSSPVPIKNDMLVPLAGYPLYLSAPPAGGGPNRVFVLDSKAGVVTYTSVRGTLTEIESSRVEDVLKEMNAAAAESRAPGT